MALGSSTDGNWAFGELKFSGIAVLLFYNHTHFFLPALLVTTRFAKLGAQTGGERESL